MESDTPHLMDIITSLQSSHGSGNLSETVKVIKSLLKDGDVSLTLSTFAQIFTCCKWGKCNRSLVLFVAQELQKWCAKTGSYSIDEDVKVSMIPIVAISQSSTALILIKIFQLDQAPNGFLKPYIEDFISQERLKEAGSLVAKLHLQEQFSIYELVLPLFTQNRIGIVEDYLSGVKSQQYEMITVIDSWLKPGFDIISFLQEKGIHQVRQVILNRRFLMKLLVRWLKIYLKIDHALTEEVQKICPNLCRQKSVLNIKYFLRRHYVEESSSVETTQELIQKAVGDDQYLQEQVVDILGNVYGDWSSAKQWAKLYNVYNEQLHHYQGNLKNDSTQNFETDDWTADASVGQYLPQKNENKMSDNTWYNLEIPLNEIVNVRSNDALKMCVTEMMHCEILGFDSEWVSFGHKGSFSVALLQIATANHVYLIDALHFGNSSEENMKCFCHHMQNIFNSKDVLKIGFGIREDLHNLECSFPALKNLSKNCVRIVDLSNSVRILEMHYPDIFDLSEKLPNRIKANSPSRRKETGLSKLMLKCFGKRLNKSEQLSDWERRPLRPSQTIYAATDAYVLLELYNFIHEKMKLRGIEYTLETVTKMQIKNREMKPKSKCSPIRQGETSQRGQTPSKQIMPHELKVVCDNMLQGLGRQLRCCGVDVKTLSLYDGHDIAAKIAKKEGRIILTCGAPFQFLASQVPIGHCLKVPNNVKAKDQAVMVLERYNVKVTAQDIFSRCQFCNGNKYLKVASDIMKQCIKRRQEMLQCHDSINAKTENKNSSIPWDMLRVDSSVSDFSVEGQSSSASVKYLKCAGRGRAIKERCLDSTPTESEYSNQLVRIQDLSLESDRILNDSDDGSDSDLMFTGDSSAETECREFASISSLSIENESDSSKENVGVIATTQKNISSVDEKYLNIASTTSPVLIESDSGAGIQKKDQNSPAKKHNDNFHVGGRYGTIPYIINPGSVCTKGFVNISNVTIVSSDSVDQDDQINPSTSVDASIVPLLCEQVPHPVLSTVKLFYCCVQCGKVYWEGRHFASVLEQFSAIISP